MPIEVRGPDGITHQFPDGTPHDQINTQMGSRYPEYTNGSLRPVQQPPPGSLTPAGGNIMPNSQVQPPYLSDEDFQNLAIGARIPHAAQILQHSPGLERQRALQRKVGENQANLEDRQRAGRHLLDMMQNLLARSAYQHDQQGNVVNDPRGHPVGAPGLNSAIGPINSNDWFQRLREGVNVGDIMGTRQGYNTHNRLTHAVDALTTAFVAAGNRGGVQMSDSRQKAFTDTLGRMMHATNPEEFNRIVEDANHFITQTFELAPGQHVAPRGRAPPAPNAAPQVGEVRRGFRFNGGDPAAPNNWSRAQ